MDRQEKLRAILQKKRESKSGAGEISRISDRQDLPLSFAQERMWFIYQWEPRSYLYNRPTVLRLTGELGVEPFDHSFNMILKRHESLRTVFPIVDGTPVQRIQPFQEIHIPIVDLSETEEKDSEAQVHREMVEIAKKPFDLAVGPLVRVKLFRIAEDTHIFLFVTHHINFDHWSEKILIRELLAGYEKSLSEDIQSFAPLPIQYAEFSQWQRSKIQGQLHQRNLAYWKNQLRGELPKLSLPTDDPRPAVQTYNGSEHTVFLDRQSVEKLKELSRDNAATLFAVLLSAFYALLYRYSGQTDLLVGTPVSGRNQAQVEKLIGLFINTLVLRADLSGSPTAKEVIRMVQGVALQAIQHQDMQFEQLVQTLQPERDLSRTPLFQVMFNFENIPFDPLPESSVQVEVIQVDLGVSPFDLSLEITPTHAGGLSLVFQYNTDLFRSATIKRLADHYQILLKEFIANPNGGITKIPLLTTEEINLVNAWNDTRVGDPENVYLHALFEKQAELMPENIAVVFENQQMTYGELNARANQVAHYLMDAGVGPEVCVGLCVERSSEMAVGILGILKAGGVYLPLAPDLPDARLQFMVNDANAKIVLTTGQLGHQLSGNADWMIDLDKDWKTISSCSQQNPVRRQSIDSAAYVIYTSGSTGLPKGVVVGHSAIVDHILFSIDRYHLDSSDRVLQYSSIGVDASIEQIFEAWGCGAQLVLPGTNLLSVDAFRHMISENQITVVDLPPAYWQHVLDEARNTDFVSLKLLILGGEALSLQLAQQTRRFLPEPTVIFNAYGPTEAAVGATLYELTENIQDGAHLKFTPIGSPNANTQIYILDETLNPVPFGVAGELCIAGTGLAREYLNLPELTAERFINIMLFGNSVRIYRTGDLARWHPDGALEYLGRLDSQVKIRGFRIELGEIEAVIRKLPEISDGVVLVWGRDEQEKFLCAYLILEPVNADSVVIDRVKSHLKDYLPAYMIPSCFMVVDKFPMTPNGKIDRQRFPEPAVNVMARQTRYAAPKRALEEQLVEIWEGMLGVKPIGVDSNFFELGGHSLLVIQLISRVRNRFHVEIPVKRFFEAPTISGLAEYMDRIDSSRKDQHLLPKIKPVPRNRRSG